MKSLYFFVLTFFILISCNNSGTKKSTYRQESVGSINALRIIITDELWGDTVGDTIRKYFAAPTDGLPQDEPLFTMYQMKPESFKGFMRSNRLFIHATINDKESFKIAKDPYARPQTGVIVSAPSTERLIALIAENQEDIIETFHRTEIKERQRRTNISPKKIDSLKEHFGISLKIPSAYRIASQSEDFYWFRKDLKDAGTTNVLVYEAPLYAINNDSVVLNQIIKIRDNIGGNYLPVEDDAKFITDQGFSTSLYNSQIDEKFAYETKGIWEVEGAFMAGPFINFAVYDEKNARYLIVEGFTYAPTAEKRNLQFELESILRSVKFI
jgi:hypothetical protein